jgi:hypothetical protein
MFVLNQKQRIMNKNILFGMVAGIIIGIIIGMYYDDVLSSIKNQDSKKVKSGKWDHMMSRATAFANKKRYKVLSDSSKPADKQEKSYFSAPITYTDAYMYIHNYQNFQGTGNPPIPLYSTWVDATAIGYFASLLEGQPSIDGVRIYLMKYNNENLIQMPNPNCRNNPITFKKGDYNMLLVATVPNMSDHDDYYLSDANPAAAKIDDFNDPFPPHFDNNTIHYGCKLEQPQAK